MTVLKVLAAISFKWPNIAWCCWRLIEDFLWYLSCGFVFNIHNTAVSTGFIFDYLGRLSFWSPLPVDWPVYQPRGHVCCFMRMHLGTRRTWITSGGDTNLTSHIMKSLIMKLRLALNWVSSCWQLRRPILCFVVKVLPYPALLPYPRFHEIAHFGGCRFSRGQYELCDHAWNSE